MLWNVSFVLIIITLLASSTDGYNPPPRDFSAWGYFNPPILQRVPQTQQTPMEAMVELTNELAVAILQDHSLSRGNFAFSPYGVASVLVVLYEGARGESARQIHRAVGFPSDKDIIRVGFRDIHRNLRSYFSHEGYLSGISLNREGSSLRPEYRKILRFYGYDVDLNHSADEEEGGVVHTTKSEETQTTASTAYTLSPAFGSEETQAGTTTESITTEPSKSDETTVEPEAVTEKTVKKENDELDETTSALPTTVTEPFESGGDNIQKKDREDIKEFVTDKTMDNGMLIPQPEDSVTTDSSTVYSTPTEMTSFQTEVTTTSESAEIREDQLRGSSVASTNEIKMSKNVTEIEEKRVSSIRNMFYRRSHSWLTGAGKKWKSRKARTITDYLKTPHNPQLSLQLQNGMYDTHISRNANLYRSLPRVLFLVDGAIDTPVPMMTYTNVFLYAYIPRLHSKAMEFPLDDERYKLLILLPVERRGLRQLIYDLTGFPLNNVLKALRPKRVKAMVPTFMVEGFVILTSSLQKLGIWDVFDPRKANLSGMSMDPELYVRNVEQSVTVVIRNYVEILDIQTRTMAARLMELEFEATHPFLYFVLDTATNVALMAGQILDPQNSRIY